MIRLESFRCRRKLQTSKKQAKCHGGIQAGNNTSKLFYILALTVLLTEKHGRPYTLTNLNPNHRQTCGQIHAENETSKTLWTFFSSYLSESKAMSAIRTSNKPDTEPPGSWHNGVVEHVQEGTLVKLLSQHKKYLQRNRINPKLCSSQI